MYMTEPSAMIIPDGIDGDEILKKIECAARTCYQSLDKIGDGTAEKLISGCIQKGHESILEHCSVSVLFTTDRAVHNELVRHRLTAVSCESTRYCRYSDGICVICPERFVPESSHYDLWFTAMSAAEKAYIAMLDDGVPPETARSVLPLSLACHYVVTANLREWRHIFKLRCSPAAHPEMRRVMKPLLCAFKKFIPVIFDDIIVD